MTPTVHADRPTVRRASRSSGHATTGVRLEAQRSWARRDAAPATATLACYLDASSRRREVLRRPGVDGSVLVIDRDAATLGDRRLIAHLAADEPEVNAAIVCSLYMGSPQPGACRTLSAADLDHAPLSELEGLVIEGTEDEPHLGLRAAADDRGVLASLIDPRETRFTLELRLVGMSIPELRWLAHERDAESAMAVSLREVIGAMESYEPARSLTARAVLVHHDDPKVSVAALGVELERLNASRTVLNRGLREAVLKELSRGPTSMSEVALRCGRVKRDARGMRSGETTWLARRIGIAADGPDCPPTPWVHSDVLALIAREGLCLAPREVELG